MGLWTGVGGWNAITVILVAIVAVSVLQGLKRGASGSARQLLLMLAEGVATALSLYLAWRGMQAVSPWLADRMAAWNLDVPARKLSYLEQGYYTLITSIRDFTLLRGVLVLAVLYSLVKGLINRLLPLLLEQRRASVHPDGARPAAYWASAPAGALIGAVTGTARALLFTAAVLVYASLFPDSPVTTYASRSVLYQKGTQEVIVPLTGQMLSRLPVLTRSVQEEFNQVLRRKYEVLDAHVPDDIAKASHEITAGLGSDEAKAKALYQWVGTRVRYDWEKARLYEEERIWKEQTPEDTFNSRTGVCIDYSRLYAVMARTAGLDVRVVTGLGSDGRGNMGSHAWNEVFLAEKQIWVPLDATWVSSGGNWFNPADFYDTHIKEV